MINIKRNEWKVDHIGFTKASKLVKQYHYSHSHSKNASALHGLFMFADDYNCLPYGLCWWIPPPSPDIARYCSEDSKNVLSLSRMVILPDAPRNAASFLLSHSIKLLPERYHTLVTYADTWQGHTGAIYKATNWYYDGLTEPKAVYVDEFGAMISTRKGNKTLTNEEMGKYKFVGFYRKHRFIYYRQKQIKERQLSLFQ